jgi:hypothetical protein
MKGLLLAVLLVAAPAHGQSVAGAREALDAIRAQDKLLESTFNNLRDMGGGTEHDGVSAILDDMNLLRTSVSIATSVGNLLLHMRDERDAVAVRVQLQYSLNTVLQQTEIIVKHVNGVLGLMKQPAIVAEASKVRDAMIAIRKQLLALKT